MAAPPLRHQLDGYLATPADQRKLLTTMVGCEFAEGKEICMQGVPGTSFFIFTEGTADVLVDGKVVRTLQVGSCCGELSAMGASSRSATVRATSAVKAVCARAKVFKLFFGSRIEAKRAEWTPFLAGLRLASGAKASLLSEHLSDYGLALLADVLQPIDFPDGEWLSKKGAAAGSLAGGAWDGRVYFVVEGEVVDEKQNLLCGVGHAFGHLEALQCKAASIETRRARGKLRCAAVEASAFRRLVSIEAAESPPAEPSTTLASPAPPPKPDLGHFADLWTTEQMLDGLMGPPRGGAATSATAPTVGTPVGKAAPAEPLTPLQPPPTTRTREPGLLMPTDVGAADAAAKRVAEYERLLERVPMLQGLKREQRQKLVDAIDEVSFHSGEVVVAEGRASPYLYLIMSGRVTLSKRGEGDLGPAPRKAGDFFGERSLQSSGPALASATAAAACVLARIERSAFDRMLGKAALEAWSTTLAGAKTARGVAKSSWMQQASARATARRRPTLEEAVDAPVVEADTFERAEAGASVQQFTVGRKPIGTGGFGKVHCCRHTPTGTLYALKVLDKGMICKMGQAAQVVSESATLTTVNHPFISNKFASLQTPCHAIVILEFCPGGDLYDLLKKRKRLEPPAVRAVLCQLSLALEHVHSRAIVHRDIKPENLMLDAGGTLKLTDFGFAKPLKFRTFTLCGTPAYMAPEVVLQRGHGKAVDFWATGCVLYELLHGKSPFGAPTANASYALILKGQVDYPDSIPEDAADLIDQLLQKALSRRIGNMAGGYQDLKDHPFCAGLDWERPSRHRIVDDVRPFDITTQDMLPAVSVITSKEGPTKDVKQSLFDGF